MINAYTAVYVQVCTLNSNGNGCLKQEKHDDGE